MTIILFKGEDNHFKPLVEVINKYNVPYCIREGALQTYLQVDKSYTYEQVQILHAEKKLNDILGYKMLSVKEAKDIVHSKSKINIINVTSNNLTIDDVVAEDIYSVFNHPLYPTSMRDGYGWNTKWNKDSKLKVINSIYAEGDEKNKLNNIQENETVYITTGGVVPKEFDCIVMIEDVNRFDDIIVIKKYPSKSGSFIRGIGSDIKKGELLVSKGTQITPYYKGLLLSARIESVSIYKKPKVSIYSSGNEIKTFEEYLIDKQEGIIDINSPIIQSRLSLLTNNIVINKPLKDNLQSIKETINNDDSDIIIISGGASVGEHDYTKMALMELDYKIHFCKINMMPGKPFTFATKDGKNVFSLAGNPVASSVLTEMFIVPFIKQLSGIEKYENDIIKCTIDFDASVNENDPRPDYQRVFLVRSQEGIVARSTGQQTSSTIKSMCGADGIVCIDRKIKKGEIVDVILINKLKRIKEEGTLGSREKTTENVPVKSEKVVCKLKIGVLTASDRASKGIYEDISGKNIMDFLQREYGDNIDIVYKVLPDELEEIKKMLIEMCESDCCLILTTGGSGPAFRDVTTLATLQVIDKEMPGFGELMRMESLKHVPTAILSGQTAGIRYSCLSRENTNKVSGNKGTLIVNLPGSPRSINECLTVVFPAIPYCIELMGWEWVSTKSGWKPKSK